MNDIPVTETDKGRVRQLIVTIILAVLLTAGLLFSVKYGGTTTAVIDAAVVYRIFVIGMAILGINFISADVLMALVTRMPLPGKLVGK